jgi:hypothetical protein
MYSEDLHKVLTTSKSHLPFKFIHRKGKEVVYEMSFWDGDKQRYNYCRVTDVICDGRLIYTGQNVSFYTELKKKAKL